MPILFIKVVFCLVVSVMAVSIIHYLEEGCWPWTRR